MLLPEDTIGKARNLLFFICLQAGSLL
ncbi:uncharacterized protein METZ01_LOCUS413305 [marine metagenome]|uniref:Uncharacterized protein n=1 Tax=marine metagenome TaxID=408172 RepID=A0A382WR05_9ZZZZ